MAKIQAVHIPAEMKNLVINGAFDFWQSQEGTTTTINTAASQSPLFTADMFKARSFGATVKNYNFLRTAANLPTLAQSGFQSTYSYQFQVLTAISSLASGDLVLPIEYVMEGLDYEKIHSKTVTFGFWFNASVAGTYSFALGNAAGSRCYVTTFTQTTGSAWEYKTITITLDNTGTWNFDNTAGLEIYICGLGGSASNTSTLNTWQAGNFAAASTATNYFATINATINFAQFSIVEGPLGFGSKGFARAGKTIQQEQSLCQRYYEKSFDMGTALGTTGTTGFIASYQGTNSQINQMMKVQKRTTPSITFWNPVSGGTGTLRNIDSGADNTVVTASINTSNFTYQVSTGTNGQLLRMGYVADARV